MNWDCWNELKRFLSMFFCGCVSQKKGFFANGFQWEILPEICAVKIFCCDKILTFSFAGGFSLEKLVCFWVDLGKQNGYGLLNDCINQDVQYPFFQMERSWDRFGRLCFLRIASGENFVHYYSRHTIVSGCSSALEGFVLTNKGVQGLHARKINCIYGHPIELQIDSEKKQRQILEASGLRNLAI